MSNAFPLDDEWLSHRRDGTLTSRSPARGKIVAPRIAWKHFVGTVDTWLECAPSTANATLVVPAEPLASGIPELSSLRWGLMRPVSELEADLGYVEGDWRTAYDVTRGEQFVVRKYEFESGFIKPTVDGKWQHGVGRCLEWRDGNWVEAWRTDPLYIFIPLPITGDFDGDGNLEIAVLPWYDLTVLDAKTGRIKDLCPITDGRSYGFLGAYDLNGNGQSEFVIQSDLAKHVDVLGYAEGKLSLLWRHAVELDISNPQKIMHVGPNPVGDVDGDGKMEVLVNVYNDLGDEKWHVTIYDGLTGEIKGDLVNQYLNGIADVDGDGAVELLVTLTDGRIVPDESRIAVYKHTPAGLEAIWQRPRAAWQMWEPPFPSNVNSLTTLSRQEVLCKHVNRQAVAVIQEAGQGGTKQVRLTRVVWRETGFEPEGWIEGPGVEAQSMDDDGRLLVRCSTDPGESDQVSVGGFEVVVLGSHRAGGAATTVAVAKPGKSGLATMVVEGARERLEAFQIREGKVKTLWRTQGRGQGWVTSWGGSDLLGPVSGALFGDDRRQVIYASSGDGGCARLVVADLSGRELWHKDFANIRGARPVQHFGGILHWQTGHFTNTERQDLLVTIRRSASHSEEAVLLDGRDGSELWRRVRQETSHHSRAVGGQPFAVADLDADGLDEVASFHPSVVLILDGVTGEDIVSRSAIWEDVPAKPVYWGVPIAADFEGSGHTSLFYGTWRGFMGSMIGLVRADGTLVWWDALDTSPCCLPAIGDVDGDGRLEAVGIGFVDGIRCYDAATGAIKWRMPAPYEWYVPPPSGTMYPVGTASGDINSDGRDEVLFAVGSTLYCVGVHQESGRGEMLWEMDLGVAIGPPSIGEAERGELRILLMGEDGYVYGVG
jgi:outer membrane protein assembly factor BamB